MGYEQEFPGFFEKYTIVHEENQDTWEFGKGALRAIYGFLVLRPPQFFGGSPS
jgi:hypothetical protein